MSLLSFKPEIGKHVSKTAKSVLVCCKCHSQVVIDDITDTKKPIYKCGCDTCPSFGKERNRKQTEWIEYEQVFFYSITKVI